MLSQVEQRLHPVARLLRNGGTVEKQESSLNRFLRSSAPELLMLSQWRTNYVVNGLIGIVMVLVALGVGIAMLATRRWELVGGMLGPLLGGVANLWVAWYAKSRGQTRRPAASKLTPEARKFLTELTKQTQGWQWGQQATLPKGPPPKNARVVAPEDALDFNVFTILEQAAYQYNRVQGVLTATESSKDVTVLRLRKSAEVAADEAIGEVFHHAATLSKYPESMKVAEANIQARIDALSELAERLEQLCQREPSLTDRLGASTVMDSVLEDLRIDAQARQELRLSESQTPD
jgi:hypothetical protein